MKADKILDELHKIREENYKKRKHLSPKEYVEAIHKDAAEAAKKLGLKIKSPQPANKH